MSLGLGRGVSVGFGGDGGGGTGDATTTGAGSGVGSASGVSGSVASDMSAPTILPLLAAAWSPRLVASLGPPCVLRV